MTVRQAVIGTVFFLAAALASLGLNDYLVYVATLAVMWAIFAVGYEILLGYTGYLSLAHGTLLGVGAYTFGLVTTSLGWPFWAAVGAAGLAAMVAGLIVGAAAFRTRGIYFAVLTLGIGLVGYQLMLILENVTGGIAGLAGIPSPPSLRLGLPPGQNQLFAGLVLLWLAWLCGKVFIASSLGAACVAVREDATLAQALGIRIGSARLSAFAFSAFFSGVAGAYFAALSNYIGPDSFTVLAAGFHVVVLVVVGGMGTLWGPILGAVLLTALPEMLRMASTFSLLLYACLLLACVILAPRGLAGFLTGAFVRLRLRQRTRPVAPRPDLGHPGATRS